MGKKYSVTRDRKGGAIYEVDGALYAKLSQVPDTADREVLARMQEGSPGRDFEDGMDTTDRAVETARTRMILLAVFGSIAVIMLLVAAVSSYDAFARSGIGEQAPGIVVDTVEEPGGEGTVYSCPVVEFTDRDGHSHTVKVPGCSSPPEWAAGDAVTVLYDPGHPADARIDSPGSTFFLWLLPGITGIVGIGFLLAVFLVIRIMPPDAQ